MMRSMVLIGLGANLPSDAGPPRVTCEAALVALEGVGTALVARSPWYASPPVPTADQPDYVNGVARLETDLGPRDLLSRLLEVEGRFGRTRGRLNAARSLDLDLLAHGRTVIDEPGLQLPHPRIADRAFVLIPLADVAPDWLHPVTGLSAGTMLARLGDRQGVRLLDP